MRTGFSDEMSQSSDSSTKVAKQAGKQAAKQAAKAVKKEVAKKAVKAGAQTAAKAAGPVGMAASVAYEVAEKTGFLKVTKGILFAIIVLIFAFPAIFSVNTVGVSFNPFTHTDEALHEGSETEMHEDTSAVEAEDEKYAEIIATHMLDEYNNLEESLKKACKKKGVEYDPEKVIDNTAISALAQGGSSGGAEAAIEWAKKIAADDSFTYGKRPTTNRTGCYFCGTNQKNKPKGYEKTYVCITFVTAAYAHGAQDPEVLALCKKGRTLSLNDSNFKMSCWKKVGNMKDLTEDDLLPGDVLVHYCSSSSSGHMSMYIGDGDIVDASIGSDGPWGKESIAIRKNRANRYLRMRLGNRGGTNYVMRYVGKGGSKTGRTSQNAEDVINGACAWAEAIAADDSFHYGQGTHAHHNGCYFCGTNKKGGAKDKAGIKEFEKTYCCNPFVHAAFAHGGGEPSMLEMCKKGKSLDMGTGNGSYHKSKLFKNMGKLNKSQLQKGDVIIGYSGGHVMLYLGNGKIAHAGSEDDNVPGSTKWKKSIRVDSSMKIERVYRYIGTGGGQMELPDKATTSWTKPSPQPYRTVLKELDGKKVSLSAVGKTAQSFVYADGKFYVQRISPGISGSGGFIEVYDKSGTLEKTGKHISEIGHGNGLGYKDGKLYSTYAGASGTQKKVRVMDTGTLAIEKRITLGNAASGIGYDTSTNKWALHQRKNIQIYSEDLSKREKTIPKKGSHGSALIQDCMAAGGVVYIASWVGGTNYIDLYDEDNGDYLGSYTFGSDEIEGLTEADGELVVLFHAPTDYMMFTGIRVQSGGGGIDVKQLARTRDAATILSTFSVFDSQLLPLKNETELENKKGIWLVLQSIRDKFRRDTDPAKTLDKKLEKAVKKGKRKKNPAFFDILVVVNKKASGEKEAVVIEINPARTDKLCKIFNLKPSDPYTTEAGKNGIIQQIFRRQGDDYEIGDTDVETAIETNTDTHLQLLYDGLEGQTPTQDELVIPIKGLFTKLKLSKKFKTDKKGIEVKMKKTREVYASERGQVTKVGKKDPKLGNYIVIEGKYKIIYANLSKILVEEDTIVARNTVIGKVKKKFRMEVYKDGEPIDPEPLFIKRKYSAIGASSDGEMEVGIVGGMRKSAPEKGNKYYKPPANNYPRNWDAGHGGNCTWYAWGRFMEIQGRTDLPSIGGDAFSWWKTTKYEKGQKPKLGAIIVWDYGTGANGHVAVVEEVKSNGDIVVTESAWGSTGHGYLFKIATYKAPDYKGHGTFKGFIYPKYPVKTGSASYESGTKGTYQKYAHSLFSEYKWKDSELDPLIKLWNKESGWNPKAENKSSGAYGIPQSLPGSKMASEGSDWKTNYKTQIKWGLKYIKSRYGSPSKAWEFHQKNNWY